MLDQWLQATARSDTFQHFAVVDVLEHDTPTDAVKAHLCDLLRGSALDLEFLADLTARLGWWTAEAIIRQRLPSNFTARRGRFGEVVGVFMLSWFEAYIVPIEKAHFAITGGQSQPSTDAVLLKTDDGTVSEVCFVESKLRTRADSLAAVEGAQQLADDYEKEVPDMLAFTASRLFDRRHPLYDAFMEYMASRDDQRDCDTFVLLLFYDLDQWTERCLANLEDAAPAVSPLKVHATRIRDLAHLVDEVFERVGLTVLEDEL